MIYLYLMGFVLTFMYAAYDIYHTIRWPGVNWFDLIGIVLCSTVIAMAWPVAVPIVGILLVAEKLFYKYISYRDNR